MGLWDSLDQLAAVQAKAGKKDETPAPQPTPDKETHIGRNALKTVVTDPATHFAHKANQGFFNFVGNVVEAAKASGQEPMPVSAMRLLLGSELVDMIGEKYDPNSVGAKKRKAQEDAALEGKLPDPTADPFSKAGVQARFAPEHEAPGPISGAFGKGFELLFDPTNMVGGPTGSAFKNSMPLLGSMVRPGLGAFGAGTAGETGRQAGGPVAAALFGEDARGTGEVAGNIAGAVAGANLSDIRYNTAKTMAEAPFKAAGNVYDAAKSAIAKKKIAGEERSLLRIFGDDYGDLSKQTQGLLTEHVRAKFADTLAADPRAAESYAQFQQALKDAPLDPSMRKGLEEQWNLGQKTTNPNVVEEIRYRIPADRVEASAIDLANRSTQDSVVKRFQSLFRRGKVAKADDVKDSLEQLRQTQNLKIDVLGKEADDIRDSVTHWDLPGRPMTADKGAELRALAEQEIGITRAEATNRYTNAMNLATELGWTAKPDALRSGLDKVLEPLLPQIQRGEAPESIRKLAGLLKPEFRAEAAEIADLQKTLLTVTDGPSKLKINRQISDLRKAMKDAETTELSLKDINDIAVSLNRDARTTAASGAQNASGAARSIEQVREALEETIQTQLPDVLKQAYADARGYYRSTHAPRAKEGVNLNLQRQAGSARAGEDKVINEKVLGEYTKPGEMETRMREFDNLFDGSLGNGQKNEDAYRILGEWIENNYHKDVVSPREVTPESHAAFMRKWNSALERSPETREKLERTFTQLADKNAEMVRLDETYKEVTGHALTKDFGVPEARATLARALADPNQMHRLVNYTVETQGKEGLKPLVKYIFNNANPISGGEYNGKELMTLLNSGKGEDRLGAMQVLFRKTYGNEVGDKHINNLRALATLAERQAMTDPKFLRSADTDKGIFQQATGQSAASWLANWNAAAQGRVSGLWAGMFSAGRFSQHEIGKAMRKLQHDALFDPAASAAVLDMAQTQSGRTLARATGQALADRMGSKSKDFMQRLVDINAITPVSVQGGRIGVTQSTEEDKQK